MWWPEAVSRRRFTGSYVSGIWQDNDPPAVDTIFATVEPSTGEARANVPPGYDSETAKLVFSTVELRTARYDGQRADQIEYPAGSGTWYVVLRRLNYGSSVLPHYEYICAEPDNPDRRA